MSTNTLGPLSPGIAGLMLRYSDKLEVARQTAVKCRKAFDPDLYACLKEIYLKACQRRVGIRAMRVWFKDLSSPSTQLSLFSNESSEFRKKSQVILTVDHIRARHGERAIRYGRV